LKKKGDWLTLLASISLINNAVGETSSNYNTLISLLMVVKSLPNVIFMPLGGILADKFDRRIVQIWINVLSGSCGILFLYAFYAQSITILYVSNFLQDSLTGLYTPSENAMVPQLVKDKSENSEELKKATTLTGLTWSLMAAIGSAVGGVLVALFGIEGCFIIDSLTYLLAAIFLKFGVQGNFDVTSEQHNQEEDQPKLSRSSSVQSQKRVLRRRSSLMSALDGNLILGAGCELNIHLKRDEEIELEGVLPQALRGQDDDDDEEEEEEEEEEALLLQEGKDNNSSSNMFVKGFSYAFCEQPLIGSYALLKGSMSLSTAATSVLNVTFSEDVNPQISALKLGSLFGFVGIGCIIGSIICDTYADMSKPKNLARLCILGFGCMVIGESIMAIFASSSFAMICFSTVVRCIGSSLIWVDSTLLIQKFTPPTLLGRVNSIDTAAALLGDCISNLGGGILMDHYDVSPTNLSWILTGLAFTFAIIWSPLAFKSPKR
jgi:MFS family permease